MCLWLMFTAPTQSNPSMRGCSLFFSLSCRTLNFISKNCTFVVHVDFRTFKNTCRHTLQKIALICQNTRKTTHQNTRSMVHLRSSKRGTLRGARPRRFLQVHQIRTMVGMLRIAGGHQDQQILPSALHTMMLRITSRWHLLMQHKMNLLCPGNHRGNARFKIIHIM